MAQRDATTVLPLDGDVLREGNVTSLSHEILQHPVCLGAGGIDLLASQPVHTPSLAAGNELHRPDGPLDDLGHITGQHLENKSIIVDNKPAAQAAGSDPPPTSSTTLSSTKQNHYKI